MENRPKPNKRQGVYLVASDSAGFILQNLINAQGVSTENPGMENFISAVPRSQSLGYALPMSALFTNMSIILQYKHHSPLIHSSFISLCTIH